MIMNCIMLTPVENSIQIDYPNMVKIKSIHGIQMWEGKILRPNCFFGLAMVFLPTPLNHVAFLARTEVVSR